MDAQSETKCTVVDLFSHRACTRREMRRIDRIRFAAVIDNRLFIKLAAGDLARPWLESLTFTVSTEDGESTAVGVVKVIDEGDGLKIATDTLSPPMRDRRVTERCEITVTTPGGETRTFNYRPTFALKAL